MGVMCHNKLGTYEQTAILIPRSTSAGKSIKGGEKVIYKFTLGDNKDMSWSK